MTKPCKIIIFGFIISLLLILPEKASAQDKRFIVHINVLNGENHEGIAEAQVFIDAIDKVIETNKDGYILIALPQSYYIFEISQPGYQTKLFTKVVDNDTTFIFYLKEEYKLLEEVEIIESRIDEKVNNIQMSIETLDPAVISQVPALGGEKDVIKTLALLPGVQSGNEGSAEIFVRGGSSDQNLYLLDNATMYHAGHALGFLSSFNPAIIDSLSLIKAGFPAKYGGRLSSVLDIRSKEANLDSIRGEVNIGLIASQASVDIPLIKNKSSLTLSGRRTYFDAFTTLISKFSDNNNNRFSYNFYDLNAKWTYYFSPQNKIVFSAYGDRDSYFDITKVPSSGRYTEDRIIWKNKIYNFQLHSQFNKKIKNVLYINNPQYQLTLKEIRKERDTASSIEESFNSYVKDWTIKDVLNYRLNEKFNFYAGVNFTLHDFIPARLHASFDDTTVTINNLPTIRSYDAAFFFEANILLRDKFKMQLGIRNSIYKVGLKNYFNAEPRLALGYEINESSTLKLSYARMVQPIHLLTNPGFGVPINLWVSSTALIAPQKSDQIAIGGIKSFNIGSYSYNISLESYYKNMMNIVSYKDGFSSANFTSVAQNTPKTWENMIARGKGNSYGTEVLFEKTTGDLKGWIGYTLSWTRHQFEEINQGKSFYAWYDRRHNLSVVGIYKITNKWNFSFSWMYATGQPVTLPLYNYENISFDYNTGGFNSNDSYQRLETLYVQGERNAYRMKPFHKLDIAFQRKFKLKWADMFLDFSIYNVYNRKNPFYYAVDQVPASTGTVNDPNHPLKSVVKSFSVFPIIPSVSLGIKF